MSRSKQFVGLVVCVAACFGAGAIGAAATTPQLPGWYASLAKPSWTPPGWVFGPAWSLLYAMMAIAAWQVWRQPRDDRPTLELSLFAVHLVANALWSVIFFGMQRPGWAAVEITVLWLMIATILVLFSKRSALAGALMAPYLLWVSFALLLNVAIWRLNS